MKKMLFMVLLSTSILTAKAQESAIGLDFGFAQTDFRLNSFLPSTDATALNLTALNGFKFGFLWDATYIKGFGSTIGLRYTYGTSLTDWSKVDPNQEFQYPRTKERYNYNQLELYVDWQYKFEIAGDTYIILTSGPSIQLGLSMQNTIYLEQATGESSETKISRYDYTGEDLRNAYNRFNIAWGIGAGFQYDRFFIRGGYDFGLMNPYKINNFNEVPELVTTYGADYSRYTRGRVDQWHIRVGFFITRWD